jgi:hypothetical protein
MMKKITILTLLMVTLVGCSKQYFSVVVWNKSDVKLRNVLVWDDGEKAYSMGVFSPQAQYVRDFMYTPLSENIKLTWTDYETGIKREVQVDMQGIIPDKYDGGTVQFDILGSDNVKAKFYFAKKYIF